MSDLNDDCKRELEGLRLASDLMHLRMAKVWSVDAGEKPAKYARAENTGSYSLLLH